jgi:hypothetical protein
MREAWARATGVWRLFGDPLPRVVDDAVLGRSLSNEGDGAYYSGAYLRQLLLARHGLSVDAFVRTPVTELQWQSLLLGLQSADDTTVLSRWDHRYGYLPAVYATSGLEACLVQYPNGEGTNGLRSLLAFPYSNVSSDFDARTLANGRPWRVRIQVLPDGRCGVALNGRPLSISAKRFNPRVPLLLITYGSSWRSRMLLGAITISEGVPGDIDWTLIGNSPARTTPRSPK